MPFITSSIQCLTKRHTIQLAKGTNNATHTTHIHRKTSISIRNRNKIKRQTPWVKRERDSNLLLLQPFKLLTMKRRQWSAEVAEDFGAITGHTTVFKCSSSLDSLQFIYLHCVHLQDNVKQYFYTSQARKGDGGTASWIQCFFFFLALRLHSVFPKKRVICRSMTLPAPEHKIPCHEYHPVL